VEVGVPAKTGGSGHGLERGFDQLFYVRMAGGESSSSSATTATM
jgi:hypothetical protein